MVDVSVVIPTHNRRQLLAATIGSVLGQVGVSLEVIVVDDGSADGTGPWLDRLAAQDARIKVVHHERPQFVSAARNAGIAHATARWIAFCDDDDLWAPGKLAAQLRAVMSSGARWASAGVVEITAQLDIVGYHRAIGGDVLSDLLAHNLIPSGSSVMAEASLVREVGAFDAAIHESEDWDLWIRLAEHSALAAVDRPLIAYRVSASSASMNVDRMRRSRATVVDRYARLAAERGVEPADAEYERYLAKQLLRAGARRQAASIFVSLVLKHGRWREVPRIPAALVAPRWTDRLGRARAVAGMPPAWQLEADAWLTPLRRANEGAPRDRSAARATMVLEH